MDITIRPARASDKDSVLAFTCTTWTWGDYIADAWDGWLGDSHGELSVAEAAGLPVAIAMCTLASADEGWLQGLRVHPDYRRQGIARALTAYQLDWLRQRGAAIVRLAVHCTNLASQSHVARTGFRQVTTSNMRVRPAASSDETGAQAAILVAADVSAAWDWITASPTWRAAAGLWADGWVWRRLTRDILAQRVDWGQVLGVRQGENWGALAIARLDPEGQLIGYADGASAALVELARALSGRAWRGKAQNNEALLPPSPQLAPAFENAGYVPEDDDTAMFIYELNL